MLTELSSSTSSGESGLLGTDGNMRTADCSLLRRALCCSWAHVRFSPAHLVTQRATRSASRSVAAALALARADAHAGELQAAATREEGRVAPKDEGPIMRPSSHFAATTDRERSDP